MTSPTRHLDLGCGSRPHNPYHSDDLHGVDIAQPVISVALQFRRANLSLSAIPYPDNCFDSVSAYDFLEHVPRILPTADYQATRFPFIELMGEVWRVLKPGGLLYAQTPAYPNSAAFTDPTHVNIITESTHEYFTRPRLTARQYGFKGDFAVRRIVWTRPAQVYEPLHPSWAQRVRQHLRQRRGACTHLIWELEACK